jgi:hypothetical protein
MRQVLSKDIPLFLLKLRNIFAIGPLIWYNVNYPAKGGKNTLYPPLPLAGEGGGEGGI